MPARVVAPPALVIARGIEFGRQVGQTVSVASIALALDGPGGLLDRRLDLRAVRRPARPCHCRSRCPSTRSPGRTSMASISCRAPGSDPAVGEDAGPAGHQDRLPAVAEHKLAGEVLQVPQRPPLGSQVNDAALDRPPRHRVEQATHLPVATHRAGCRCWRSNVHPRPARSVAGLHPLGRQFRFTSGRKRQGHQVELARREVAASRSSDCQALHPQRRPAASGRPVPDSGDGPMLAASRRPSSGRIPPSPPRCTGPASPSVQAADRSAVAPVVGAGLAPAFGEPIEGRSSRYPT